MASAGTISAVLTLNSSGFQTGLEKAVTSLNNFSKNANSINSSITALTRVLGELDRFLIQNQNSLNRINQSLANQKNFNSFATAINKISNALKILSTSEIDVVQATNTINSMFSAFKGALNGVEVKVKGVSSSVKELTNTERTEATTTEQVATATKQYEQALSVALPKQREMIINATGVSNANRQIVSSTNQASVSEDKLSASTDKATNSLKRQETASKGLGKAMSSLKMMGTMVGSMIAYNFVHNLAMATTETINAKSEMNGYFQMLGYTTSQTNRFNKALDETVQKFPRLNKYALGETISSIGVEFELTTKEMEKAMPVVSMITSEYLRAGRNVNEASLAVKDILQGEFQRLSRETGVKQDTLKEAGWSGDKNDVMGLLEALDKVGKARHWDTFVTKANSLNDAVLILQNRFSEWASDMVSVVQPAILNVFNSALSFAEGLSQSLSSAWEWFTGDSMEASITQIGLFGGALLTVSQALVQYRTGMGLAQTSQLGLKNQLASLVLGLKGQEIAEIGVRNAIMSKILGVKAEVVAERGLTRAIQEDIIAQKLATIEEQLNTASTGENTLAKELNGLYTKLEEASTKGLISAKAKETIEEQLNTASKELGTLASIEQESANVGLTASLYALGTGEIYVAGETGALATAMGVLNGVIALSPVGWFIGVVLALAGAFYVLSGGLSDSWAKMKQFHEVMKDPHDTINTYKDRVTKLNTKLEEAKSKYGEGSEEVKKYQDKLDTAKETLESVQGVVEHGVYWNDQYNESFEELGATMDSSLRDVMKGHGFSKEQIDKTGQLLDAMDLGTDKTYRALQVMTKQQEDAKVSLDEYANSLENANIKGDEASELMSNYASNLQNLQMHSAIANTTDDWWEWMWNALYAGLDQFWIDWDEFWLNQVKAFNTGDILSLIFGEDTKTNEEWTWLFDQLASIGDFFNGKSLMELLGLDENKDYVGDFFKWLTDGFNKAWNDFISFEWLGNGESSGGGSGIMKKINPSALFGNIDVAGITKWFDDTIKKPVLDAWNGFISFDWLPSVDFNFLSNLFGFGGETEQGDISWLIDWANTNIITPLTNFALNPIGTIASWGLSLPQLNLGTLIQGLFNIGGEGGFDIGGWLASIFNIDTIVSTFTSNLQVIFTTASTIASNVGNVFSNLKSMIWGHIQGILTNVTTTFTNIKNTATTQINGLASGIQGGIDKVKNAFIYMKDSILNSAKAIYDGVKQKFDSVKNTIGDFWNHLTNPSSWGSAGSESYQRRSPKPQTARRMFSPVIRSATHHGAGVNPYQNDSQIVKLKDLMNMVNGDNKVRLSDFLSMFSDGGFGTWDFHEPVKTRVFDTAKDYKTGSPNIQGIGTVGDGYKVGKFWDGKPSFTFQEFQSVAQAIFSAIPYKFYYDSEWKGSWVNALLSGAVNCSDGADALIALANVFGFSGYKQHTTLKSGVGHFFAVIGGKKMDTTNFQNHGSWSPLGGAGIPTRTANPRGYAGETQGKTVNITVDMSGATVYGIDDLDSRIQESVQKGLQEEFNDPFSVAI